MILQDRESIFTSNNESEIKAAREFERKGRGGEDNSKRDWKERRMWWKIWDKTRIKGNDVEKNLSTLMGCQRSPEAPKEKKQNLRAIQIYRDIKIQQSISTVIFRSQNQTTLPNKFKIALIKCCFSFTSAAYIDSKGKPASRSLSSVIHGRFSYILWSRMLRNNNVTLPVFFCIQSS